ncbi:DUF488 domain-containing protein [Paenibacillus montanisoli]|uniref:DUF488 domain-containing protein n=1 Tax=Paenibacillus montanisoli TaxID=2081970 RepID=A0A328TWB4_9BACL|nr:DUF488 family protein [Paenibacillus montanisoli]RAP74779.1 hypothetical protein DL346_22330 [Paenibacillus montanisoli]
MIRVKRIYDPIQESDGKRILVDRLWPRGVSKEKAGIHEWLKELAPSHELRKWFHEHAKFDEFKERYRKELTDETKVVFLKQLLKWAEEGTVTLLYSAKDEANNQAVFLAEIVRGINQMEETKNPTA